MLKKTTSFFLALLFIMGSFGIGTLFGGIITAEAIYYDNYEYTKLPGWDQFTSQDLSELFAPGTTASQSAPPSYAPENVTTATKFTITDSKPGDYDGFITVGSYVNLNFGEVHEGGDITNNQWAAKSAPTSGTTFTGGQSFEDMNGFCFWIAQNEGRAYFDVKINIFTVPCKGQYYYGDDTEIQESPTGFVYEAIAKPDEDGYVYFDFKTSFYQVDWYWSHDDGQNYSVFKYNNQPYYMPLPNNIMDLISGISVQFLWASVGDEYYLGDFNAYKDTRIYNDELFEYCDVFDALDPEAYTEESYTAATDVYLEAYDMAYDPDFQTKYTQKQVDAKAAELKAAINALKQLFPVRSNIAVNGFDVWNDDDIDAINDGGVSIDLGVISTEVAPQNKDSSILIIANPGNPSDPPYYGWSCFTSLVDNGGTFEAVKNPFGADLSDSNGLRFWMQYPEDYYPDMMRIIVGTAGEAEFVADNDFIRRHSNAGGSGYVAASWNSFIDNSGMDSDIYDYIDRLDYIGIQFESMAQLSYYIADLHPFIWSEQNADMAGLSETIENANSYIAGINEADYTPRSWQNLMTAIMNAEALFTEYGVNQDTVDAAQLEITSRIGKLIPIGDGASLAELNYLYAMIDAAKTYWRGNYKSSSFAPLVAALNDATEAIEYDLGSAECLLNTSALETAIAGLIPITNTGVIANGFHSFENWTSRDLSKSNGDRSENVDYTFATSANAELPSGYSKGLKMTAMVDLFSNDTDQHGGMQFKTMYREGGSPIILPTSSGVPVVKDLTGSAGVRLWIGVNDVSLVSGGVFRFAVSNCDKSPLFENHAIDIPLPTTGSGWLYIPWECFTFYDDWTNGQPTDLSKIGFYILRFDGEIQQGLEVYVTAIQAYTGPVETTPEQPAVSNITEGQSIDVTSGKFVPDWNVGTAVLDGKYFVYGDGIDSNGPHTLTVTNASKTTTVNFTVTGGIEQEYDTPVISGITEGATYDLSDGDLTITWDVGTGMLNDSPMTSGTPITEAGEYTLVVTNGTKHTTVNFTVTDGNAPMLGDFDDDGVLTVADALAALRIAARIVAETPENILSGDVDNDGHVTVADALAILRVAARISPSL